jgi:DNA-binding NarL/FixJ family response regulator
MHDPATNGASRLRVLVVDADERVRESLAGLLSIGDRLVVVGAAGDPGHALELVASTQPDVVVLDPRLPEVDRGRALIRRLRKASPGICVIVLSWSDTLDDGYLRCEADRFIRKTFRPSELVEAIISTRALIAH